MNLRQDDLAKSCGVKLTAISKYENEIIKPAFDMFDTGVFILLQNKIASSISLLFNTCFSFFINSWTESLFFFLNSNILNTIIVTEIIYSTFAGRKLCRRISDDVNGISYNVYTDMLSYKEVIADRIEKIRSLNYKELLNISKKIDIHNIASVIMLPKKEK